MVVIVFLGASQDIRGRLIRGRVTGRHKHEKTQEENKGGDVTQDKRKESDKAS